MTDVGSSLSVLVRAAARDRADAPAVVAGEQRLSWGELDAQVDRVAAGYAARGLAPGDRVASSSPTASTGCGRRWAHCARDWSSSR